MERAVFGTPPIEVSLRRSARARRYSLRVSRLDGQVTLTLPLRASASDAVSFARGHEGWIRRALEALPAPRAVELGGIVPFEGLDLAIQVGAVRIPTVSDGKLLVPQGASTGARVAAWLKAMARTRLSAACDRHAARLGRKYTALALRDTRSRWGSCSTDGRLMFSWRLVMAPPEVLDYVAAHEVAHLAEMNHSPAFWRVVDRLSPDHAEQRVWLRRNGGALHRFDFSG